MEALEVTDCKIAKPQVQSTSSNIAFKHSEMRVHVCVNESTSTEENIAC